MATRKNTKRDPTPTTPRPRPVSSLNKSDYLKYLMGMPAVGRISPNHPTGAGLPPRRRRGGGGKKG